MDKMHELIIIGGGPAGLTAGLYASRARIDTYLIEKGIAGGQIVNAELVENYPGFPQGISGLELGEAIHEQATKYGLAVVSDEVTEVTIDKAHMMQVSTGSNTFRAKAVIVAGGSERRKLGVPGEYHLLGKGVSYCATCDGAFFTDRNVAVVGGGDAAITEALFLTRFATKVTLIHRRDQLRASKILQERALSEPKMEFLWDMVVEEIVGDNAVGELKLRNTKTDKRSPLEVDGIFIYAGVKPNTEYLKDLTSLDEAGHVITNELMETNMPGLFAAGDIRHDSRRQAITAAGDGAVAALSAEEFLSKT